MLRRAERSNTLANRLMDRYSRTGASDDLEEAIQIVRRVLERTSTQAPTDRARWMSNLGSWLWNRYQKTGVVADLEQAIQIDEQAVSLISENDPDQILGSLLNHLAARLVDRYLRTGAIADLERSIQILRKALRMNSADPIDRVMILHNLGNALRDRWYRTGTAANLDESIQTTRKSVELAPENYSDQVHQLSNLAVALGCRYSDTQAGEDLDEAIQALQKAISMTAEGHPDRSSLLMNLGLQYNIRFYIHGVIGDLEEGIRLTRQAVNTVPEDHPDRAVRARSLAYLLVTRHARLHESIDVEEAIMHLQRALGQSNSPIIHRVLAGRRLVQIHLNKRQWHQAYEHSNTALRLIPRLTMRSLEISDKQHLISQIVGLACDSTAAALQNREAPLIALNMLEEGRGVLAASIQELRIELSDLQQSHPELADQFICLRDDLEHPVVQHSFLKDEIMGISLRGNGQIQRYDAGKKLDELIDKIRNQPNFERFLLPPNEMEMQVAAKCGPVVVINVSPCRCDALLIESHKTRAVALPYLSPDDIRRKTEKGNLSSSCILEWLWDVVANPILDALGFTGPPPNGVWPHIWWVPTGPLTKLPLHAAGYHGMNTNQTVLDRIMSSYSSSVKAIINGRRPRVSEPAQLASPYVLTVAMQETPKQDTLPSAKEEVATLYGFWRSMALDIVEPERNKLAVVSYLPNSKIFHFAGHGHTDKSDPSKSKLLLEDWESNGLTVADFWKMNFHERSPFLAYLSACGTGEIRDQNLFDENIHLISACQLAGFRHVIGTLWHVDDEICVDMAKIVYKEIKDGQMTDESVCHGLHQASRQLRDRWLKQPANRERIGELARQSSETWAKNEAETTGKEGRDEGFIDLTRDADLDDEETGPANWVPYVHYGV